MPWFQKPAFGASRCSNSSLRTCGLAPETVALSQPTGRGPGVSAECGHGSSRTLARSLVPTFVSSTLWAPVVARPGQIIKTPVSLARSVSSLGLSSSSLSRTIIEVVDQVNIFMRLPPPFNASQSREASSQTRVRSVSKVSYHVHLVNFRVEGIRMLGRRVIVSVPNQESKLH